MAILDKNIETAEDDLWGNFFYKHQLVNLQTQSDSTQNISVHGHECVIFVSVNISLLKRCEATAFF